MGFTPTPDQKRALELLDKWYKSRDRQVFRLSGYAGTGKSVCISLFQERLGLKSGIAYVAYTGKSCQVLIRKGLPACTIHRLIYNVDLNSKKLKFIKKTALDVDVELIVVDEASMVDEKCFKDLCSFGKPIVVVGDPGQLPPINGRSSCLENPDVMLTDVMRQALDNPIVALATEVRSGKRLAQGLYRGAIPIGKLSSIRNEILIKADQILCGTNKMRASLNSRVRQYIGNYDRLPVVGDKLISLRNIWSLGIGGQPVVNGTTGIVRRVISKTNLFTRVLFQPDGSEACGVVDLENCRFFGEEPEWRDPKEYTTPVGDFDYGYAITTHKAEGSEYSKVLLVEDHYWGELHSRWLYTGITRAVQSLAIAQI